MKVKGELDEVIYKLDEYWSKGIFKENQIINVLRQELLVYSIEGALYSTLSKFQEWERKRNNND